jgi:hypothetical protein
MAKQGAHRDFARTLRVGRTCFEPDYMASEPKLGSVFHGHGPLLGVDLTGEDVEQRGLAGSGTTGDEQVHPCLHRLAQQPRSLIIYSACRNQAGEVLHRRGEASNGENRPIDRSRRNDGMKPGAIGEPGIDCGAGAVDAKPEWGHDPLHRSNDRRVIRETDLGTLEATGPLNPDLGWAVYEHISHVGLAEQALDGPEPGESIDDVGNGVGTAERRLIADDGSGRSAERPALEWHVGVEEPGDDAIDGFHEISQSGRQAEIHRSHLGGAAPLSSIPMVERRGRGRTTDDAGASTLQPDC